MKLSNRHKKFADYYIKTDNIYRSARAAGYSESYSRGNAAKLIYDVSIREYINKQMEKLRKPTIATAEEVLEYLTRVARGEEKEYKMVMINGERKLIEVNPDLRERTKAAELLGKRYALFVDRQEIDIEVNKSLEDFFGVD